MREMRNRLPSGRNHQILIACGLLVLILILTSGFFCSGQITVNYLQGKKAVYTLGDEIKMSVRLVVPAETCIDGINQVRIFQSGIIIRKQTPWKEVGKGFWEKEVILSVTGNKKGYGQLTFMRKSDRQSFFYQERFDFIK